MVLILILSELSLYYIDNSDKYENYPSLTDIISNYPEGKMVSACGTVKQIQPTGFLMSEYFNNTLITFKVYSTQNVSLKDNVSVLGILNENNQIISRYILIEDSSSFYIILIQSLFAIIILFFIFNRYWIFDKDEKKFIRKK